MSKFSTVEQDFEMSNILKKNIKSLIVDFSDILSYIESDIAPEDIYNNGQLDEWALSHGYVKDEQP